MRQIVIFGYRNKRNDMNEHGEQEIMHSQTIDGQIYCFMLLVEYDIETDSVDELGMSTVDYPVNERFDLDRSNVMALELNGDGVEVDIKPLIRKVNKSEVFEQIEICY